MAYDGSKLSVVDETIEGNWTEAVYISTDSLATVTATNYFSDGQIRGLEVGDEVKLLLSNVLYIGQVSAVQTGGYGATVSGLGGGALNGALPPAQYKTAALQAATIVAANMAGAADCFFDNTGTTPGSLPTDTAAAIIAAVPGWQIGQSYVLEIRNDSGSANTATITAGTGVTLTGTMTIAQNVTRRFVVTYTGAGAVTIQSMGISAAGA